MSDHSRILELPFLPIHTHELYQVNVFDTLGILAQCMHQDPSNYTKAPWRLYTQLVHQGFKRRGLYEIQMPHLIRVNHTTRTTNSNSINTLSFHDCSGKLMFRSLATQTTSGIPSGLYTCHLQLHLSNPQWRLEDVVNDPDTKLWVFPTPPPRECEVRCVVTLDQRIGDLPEDKQDSDPTPPLFMRTSIRETVKNFVTDFMRVFDPSF